MSATRLSGPSALTTMTDCATCDGLAEAGSIHHAPVVARSARIAASGRPERASRHPHLDVLATEHPEREHRADEPERRAGEAEVHDRVETHAEVRDETDHADDTHEQSEDA